MFVAVAIVLDLLVMQAAAQQSKTAKVAPTISRFDPDQSWQKAEP